MNQEVEAKKADNARIRHDNRLDRHEIEKKEKEERQRQRKLALAATKAAKEKKEAENKVNQSTDEQEK